MSRRWRYLLPAYVFCLPMSIAGFVIAWFFYGARQWAWYDGVLTSVAAPDSIWGRPNAQTLGWIQIFDTAENRAFPDLRVHENVHVVQAFASSLVGLVLCPLLFLAIGHPLLGLILGGFIGGVGFAGLYGIIFLYLLITQRNGWYQAYRNNPFEVQAYNLQDKYLADTTQTPWGV